MRTCVGGKEGLGRLMNLHGALKISIKKSIFYYVIISIDIMA